jgi:hypothetical protein
MNDRELLVNRSKTDQSFGSFGSFGSFASFGSFGSFGSFDPRFRLPKMTAVNNQARRGRLIAESSNQSVLATLRALRRRLRCELRTEGLHQFDFRSGRCIYCGSKLPRAAGSTDTGVRRHTVAALRDGRSAWLEWVVKNTRAITSRFRSASR